MKLVCEIREIVLTVKLKQPVSGHTFESEYEGYESAFHPLKCKVCGTISE